MAESENRVSVLSMQLICAFVFAYEKSRFSHDADQLYLVANHRRIFPKIFKVQANLCFVTSRQQRSNKTIN